jgi:hypothetical protein
VYIKCYLIYRCYLGAELLKSEGSEYILKTLWHHSDAIMCCSLNVFFFLIFFSYESEKFPFLCLFSRFALAL